MNNIKLVTQGVQMKTAIIAMRCAIADSHCVSGYLVVDKLSEKYFC